MLSAICAESGQGLVEYALILVFIALAVIVGVSLFGNEVNNTFSFIVDQIPSP